MMKKARSLRISSTASASLNSSDSRSRTNGHRTRGIFTPEEQIIRLVESQEETARAISDLNVAIRELKNAINKPAPQDADRRLTQSETDRRLRMSDTGFGNNTWRVSDPMLSKPKLNKKDSSVSELKNDESDDDEESAPDDELGFDRKQVRLDGLEVYAVVSAVTAGTLVAVFDSYNPGDMMDLLGEGRYLEVLLSAIFLVIGTIGIVCGLHCIFVFSLVTMYGRTALGMERDEALEIFFANTGLQRIHGFRTFVGSLYALMCELIVVITSKFSTNPWVLVGVFVLTGRLMFYVYNDTQIIMEKAMVIFSPPTATKRRRTLVSAQSALNMDIGDLGTSDSEDEFSQSLEKEAMSNTLAKIRSESASTVDSQVKKNNEEVTSSGEESRRKSFGSVKDSETAPKNRRDTLAKRKSAMHMPATTFTNTSQSSGKRGSSGSRGLRWSIETDENEDKGDDNKTNVTDNSSQRPRMRKKKSTLTMSAEMQMANLEEEDENNDNVMRKKRSSLSPFAAMQIRQSIEDDDNENKATSRRKRGSLYTPLPPQIVEDKNDTDTEYW